MFHILWILTNVIVMTRIHHCSVLQKSFTAVKLLCSSFPLPNPWQAYFWSACLEQILSVAKYIKHIICPALKGMWAMYWFWSWSSHDFFLHVWMMMVRYYSLVCNFFLNWNHLANSEVILRGSKDNRWFFSSFTLNRFSVKLLKFSLHWKHCYEY